MALPGTVHACHPSGWIQSKIFSQWFLHFIKHTKPTKEDPVILVLDGHYSHTRNLEVLLLERNTPSDLDTDLAVHFTYNSMEEDEEQDADCVFCTGRFSEDHNGED